MYLLDDIQNSLHNFMPSSHDAIKEFTVKRCIKLDVCHYDSHKSSKKMKRLHAKNINDRKNGHQKTYNHNNRYFSFSRIALMCILPLVILSVLVDASQMRTIFTRAARASVIPRSGVMKLCPPGGESFASAWQMACGMRRRKKRDVGNESESSKNTTRFFEHEALQAVAGMAINEAEPLVKIDGGDVSPASENKRRKRNSEYYSYNNNDIADNGNIKKYNPFAPASLELDTDIQMNLLQSKTRGSMTPSAAKGSVHFIPSEMAALLAELDSNSGVSAANEKAPATSKEAVAAFRAPSISEMMMVCCRYGCSLRDLLPYCSPFGEWDY